MGCAPGRIPGVGIVALATIIMVVFVLAGLASLLV
jgi:hypothetical protein